MYNNMYTNLIYSLGLHKRMAGHLGSERVTIQNLDVVKVDAENNLIAIKGAIPGPKKGIVMVVNSVKKA